MNPKAPLPMSHEGPPGAVHGGIVAAYLDEVLAGAAVHHTGRLYVTGELSVRYVKPTPVECPLLGRGRPVAAVVYERRQHMINLFVWPASDARAAIDARSIRGFQVRHWIGNGMSFWAVSDLNDQELDRFVRALRQ